MAEPGRAGWKRDSKEELPLLYGKLLLVDDARALMGEWEVESVDGLSFLGEGALGPSRHASQKPPRPGSLRPWAASTAP